MGDFLLLGLSLMNPSPTSLSGGSACISDGGVSTVRIPNTSACFSTSFFHTASALSPMPFSVTSSRGHQEGQEFAPLHRIQFPNFSDSRGSIRLRAFLRSAALFCHVPHENFEGSRVVFWRVVLESLRHSLFVHPRSGRRPFSPKGLSCAQSGCQRPKETGDINDHLGELLRSVEPAFSNESAPLALLR
jgi:hypothetical protein